MRLRSALGAAAALIVLVTATGAAETDGTLRITAIDAREFPVISAIVTPPPELFGVEPAEVVVTENGVEVPSAVTMSERGRSMPPELRSADAVAAIARLLLLRYGLFPATIGVKA